MADTLLFLRELITRPRQISAIAPSSRHLARAMAADLRPGMRVVEFGPGTGRLTRGILAAGVRPADLALFEMSADFCRHLATAFPGAAIHNTGAQRAPELYDGAADAVISGLPLLSMPVDLREAIVRAAFTLLGPGGIYVQFTYGPRPAVSGDQIARLNLRVTETAHVWLNLPPARVHRFERA